MAEKQWMSTKEIIKGFAPMTPARFRERVDRGHHKLPDGLVLKFTHRPDEEIVVKLQEKIFLQQAPRHKKLVAKELPEAELLLLAESLPYFVNLKGVLFDNLEIGEASAVALIEGLKTLRHLTWLGFNPRCRIEEQAVRLLAQGLLQCQFPGDLEVIVLDESGPEKLAKELRPLKRIGRVFVRYHSCFVIKAAAGVEEGRQSPTEVENSLKSGWLGRQLAKFRCCKRRATDTPRATPDDALVRAHV